MKYFFLICLFIACFCTSQAQSIDKMPQKIVLYANDIEADTPYDVTPNMFCKQISMHLVDSIMIQDSSIVRSIIEGLSVSSTLSSAKRMDVRGMILLEYGETEVVKMFYSRFSLLKRDTLYSISPSLPYLIDSIRRANVDETNDKVFREYDNPNR